MYENDKIIVLKFGSSILRKEEDLPRAVHEIYYWWRRGSQVVAVTSAIGNTTDSLLGAAEKICASPERTTLAALLATGETTSSALLALALNRAGIPSRVLDPVQAGLRTAGGTLDAELIGVDVARLKSELRRAVVVLPGFIGRGDHGNTTLLGRGGSDLSALFLAHRLGAECLLLKDVDGIYAADPATAASRPARFAELRYETAMHLAGSVVQLKAIRFAAAHRVVFSVGSIGSTNRSVVGTGVDRLEVSHTASAPTRVALLGCGTVGGGVYQTLKSLPDLFTVTGVGTRNPERARLAGVPESLIAADVKRLIQQSCDVVVELIGGQAESGALVQEALLANRNVVTANKALLAHDGEHLISLAVRHGTQLRYSAAVGGAMPALEAVAQLRRGSRIRSLRGVLNGTTNFVLDRVANGDNIEGAIDEARRAGYAEHNYHLDLDGTDAAQKLILLAREAFGTAPRFEQIERLGIHGVDGARARDAATGRQAIRLVASCERVGDEILASVRPEELRDEDPLAQTTGTDNCLEIKTGIDRAVVLRGKGAGRWPTTEAIVADLLDIRAGCPLLADARAIEEEECA
jgi:homoserine dehydrogenase